VLASLVVALTLTPALCLILLRDGASVRREPRLVDALKRGYAFVLTRIITRPRRAYGVVAVIALGGVLTVPQLGQSLLPEFKERDFLMHWVTDPATSQEEETRITVEASKELRAIPGVRNFGAHIGQALAADEVVGVNFGENWISVDPDVDYDATLASIQEVVDGYPGLRRDVQTYLKERIREVLTGTSEPVVIRIYGEDLETLRSTAQEVLTVLGDVDGIVEEQVDLAVDVPQVLVEVDLAKAQTVGLKPGDVRRAASTLIAGEEVGDIFRDGKAYDVVVWSTPETRNSLTSVQNLPIDTPDGGSVWLDEVADVSVNPTPNLIEREGGSRRIDVSANVSGRDLGAVVADVEERLAGIEMPLGFHTEMLGEFTERQAAQQRLLLFAGAALLAILALLQATFGSWRLTALAFITLPMALVGGVLAAFFTDGVLSLGSLVGLFTVFGIAARNSILLINHYQHLERHEGEAFGPALVIRGSLERLSPILMTSLATGLALVPLVVAGSIPGHEVEHPLAVVILGGLVTSTLLNLLVVPSLYLRFGRATASRATA